ncbi:putative polysaccharide biosynthesis protein [Bacillus suaedaesalsae]|uniref:Polysaccharide biosynthesis protein n=1 Tax=Bacillus suaedaesalsae TaxID=2810349 RepID=A0ABS2DEE5_9BACI|nr:polysaccharide biosynthesis protein [Bacillus suaedaesalsae]MBM6616380.1 polysaccharide biosynthesis protein [Bacillus suaedaesalsae]
MSSSNLLKGTFILTLGTYISRFLGMIYVFPFAILVGETGAALYGYGYNQYAIFLSISTVGVPMAVSKFVSKYNALGDYQTSRKMFKNGLLLMIGMGVLSFLIMYTLAPFLAQVQLAGEEKLTNSVEDIVNVMRMVSFALLIVPIMSVIRGFFQGNQSMEPTAVSQVIEQLVRVVFLIGAVYLIREVAGGEISTAVGYATFGAFIGAIAGLAVLGWYWYKKKNDFDLQLESSKVESTVTTKQMMKELFTYAGPFVLVGLAIPLYQYVDGLTFNRGMILADKKDIAEKVLGIITFYVNKLVMIPVSLATAFGLTLVPAITKAFTDRNRKSLHTQIDQSFQVVFFLTLPAVVGLAILSDEIYAMFYGASELGANLLAWYAPVAVLFAFFTVTAAILQGIQKQKLAVISLFFGLILKISLNIPFITWFEGVGSILATGVGYLGSVVYSLAMIKRHANFSYRLFFKRSVLMLIFSMFMILGISILLLGLSPFMTYEDGRFEAIVLTITGVAVGAGIYLYLSYRSNLAGKLLGTRFSFLKKQKVRG